jgi:hypothetical protein
VIKIRPGYNQGLPLLVQPLKVSFDRLMLLATAVHSEGV